MRVVAILIAIMFNVLGVSLISRQKKIVKNDTSPQSVGQLGPLSRIYFNSFVLAIFVDASHMHVQ